MERENEYCVSSPLLSYISRPMFYLAEELFSKLENKTLRNFLSPF